MVGALTAPSGDVVGMRPGPHASTTPRTGDSIVLGSQLQQADNSANNIGFTRLLKGSSSTALALFVDWGYIYHPNVNTCSNPTPLEWCDKNDVLMIWPFKIGERAFEYDEQNDLMTCIENNQDLVRALNSALNACMVHSNSGSKQ